MLTLQFAQPSEFENPYYQAFCDVDNNNHPICTFQFDKECCYWYIQVSNNWLLTDETLNEILEFHKDITAKIEPKILGVL